MLDKAEFKSLYIKIFDKNGLNEFTNDNIIDKMFKMTEHMLNVNEHMNLTAITDVEGIIAKHLADSVTVSRFIPKNATVCDVGCGGGFPSIPLAITRPDIKIIGVDSTEKRINYVNESAKLLCLDNLNAISGRAEDFSRETTYRERFDVCVARAVANLPVLSELCIPFVKVRGKFIAMKGRFSEEEFNLSAKGCEKLGCEPLTKSSVHRFNLYSETSSEERTIVELVKLKQTPSQYPRNYSQIKKKPL